MAGEIKPDELIDLKALKKNFDDTVKSIDIASKSLIGYTESLKKSGMSIKEVADASKQFAVIAKSVNDVEKSSISVKQQALKLEQQQAKEIQAKAKELENQAKEQQKATQEEQKASTSSQNLAKIIRENTKELISLENQGKRNSQQYRDLVKTTGELKDQLGDTRAQIKYFSSDTKHIDTLVGGLQAANAAAQLVEGSMALFGIENKNVAETIKKLVALQSIANGLQTIKNALEKESALSMGATVLWTNISTASQKLYNWALNEGAVAAKVFKTALIGIGIGAIIVLVGTLISNWEKLTSIFKDSASSLGDNKKAIDDINKSTDTQNGLISKGIELLKAKGASDKTIQKFEQQQRDNSIKAAQEAYDLEVGTLKKISNEKQKYLAYDASIEKQGGIKKFQDKTNELYADETLQMKKVANAKTSLDEVLNLNKITTAQIITDNTEKVKKEKELNDKKYDEELKKQGDVSLAKMQFINKEKEALDKQNEIEQAARIDKYNKSLKDLNLKKENAKAEIDIDSQKRATQAALEYQSAIEKGDASVALEQDYTLQLNQIYIDNLQAKIDSNLYTENEIDKMREEKAQAEIARIDMVSAKRSAALVQGLQTTQQFLNAGFELGAAINARAQSDLDKKYKEDIKNAGAHEEAKKRIEDKYQKESAKLKRKAAIADKASALINAGINIALGITNALSKVITAPLAPIIAALGAIQIAAIAAKPIPQFKHGVTDFQGGMAVVGDGFKSELIKLTDGSQFLSPAVPTMMNLPKGTTVVSGNETEKLTQRNEIDFSELIKDNQLTRKAIGSIKQYKNTTTSKGREREIISNNMKAKFIDTYFGS